METCEENIKLEVANLKKDLYTQRDELASQRQLLNILISKMPTGPYKDQ